MIGLVYAHAQEIKFLKQAAGQLSLNLTFIPWKQLQKIQALPANIKLVINAGFAGSLNQRFLPGQVCLVTTVMAFQNGQLQQNKLQLTWLQESQTVTKLPLASVYTSSLPVINSKLRDQLAVKTKADLVDMEAYEIFQLVRRANIPFLAFKVVSDKANEETVTVINSKKEHYAQLLAETVIHFLPKQRTEY